jgi:predicted TIM-barrel fold metal-dependent hydrolase
MNRDSITIVDCHAHILDAQLHTYPIFRQRSPGFEALVGDYSPLPRRYLPEDYLKDANGLHVIKTVWAEFMSTDPISEVQWVENLLVEESYPHGIIALVDFLSPDVERVLASYCSLRGVRAVREHLAWHPTNPLLRFASRPNVLADKAWQEHLALLRKYELRGEIEIFAPQLPQFKALASSYPDIQFILPVMGWPIDLTEAGHRDWKRGMEALSNCENIAVKIFGMECIFGLHWTIDQIRPWVLDIIDLFGPERCMFASHMPIAKLACSFQELYSTYFDIVSEFSDSEKRKLFRDTATMVYGLASPDQSQDARSHL